MSATAQLRAVLEANRRGEPVGVPSICSADPMVLEAALAVAAQSGGIACIESTCNQVNQFGGYTTKTPADFRGFVHDLARATGLPAERVLLGGDHLGPWPWQDEPASLAMGKAHDLVRACVLAGYTKLHIDTSMRCADDPGDGFADPATAAARTAELIAAAEVAHGTLPPGAPQPVYVVGTEVPPPGGEAAAAGRQRVPAAGEVEAAVADIHAACAAAGLDDAWERVIALVVQPGVEFGDDVVFDYDPAAARELVALVGRSPHGLVYEAHSTDYQTAAALRQLVADHFAILKVGPALTFAMREALFGLEAIETELRPARPSRLRAALEDAMAADPRHWQSYHRGDEETVRVARLFALSDRVRYYWPQPPVRAAVERLLGNLAGRPIPLGLLAQHLPAQFAAVRAGELDPAPAALVHHAIGVVVREYVSAASEQPG